eukprot:2497559-Rhodomonas_salina.2
MAPEKGIDVEGKVWVSPPALTEMHNVQDMMVGPEGTALQKAALAGDERQVLASLPPSPQSHQLLDFPTCSPARSLARAILGQTLAQDHEQKFQSSSDAETRLLSPVRLLQKRNACRPPPGLPSPPRTRILLRPNAPTHKALNHL